MRVWKQMVRAPAQALTPRTLVEILGKTRLLVEHHRGILQYGTEEIIIGATFGMIIVTGRELRVCCMNREQVFLAGTVDQVSLEGSQ